MDIPRIWCGTRKLKDQTCLDVVSHALEIWYRHIDTATIYENEKEVWEAIQHSSVSRESIWLTSKLRMDDFDNAAQALEDSLNRLDTEYLDLYLLHWPTNHQQHEKAFDALLPYHEKGVIKHIWVSNFPIKDLEHALEYTDHQIFCNQVEMHLFLGQDTLVSYCDQKGVLIQAYSPLASGHVFAEDHLDTLQDIASRYQVTIAQLALQYLVQQDMIVLPRSSSSKHITNNFDLFFTISKEDMERLHQLPKNKRYIDPAFSPDWD